MDSGHLECSCLMDTVCVSPGAEAATKPELQQYRAVSVLPRSDPLTPLGHRLSPRWTRPPTVTVHWISQSLW